MMCGIPLILAAVVWSGGGEGGVGLSVETGATRVDPARSMFVTLKLTAPKGVEATPPDLRPRVRGFSLAEEFAEEPETAADGSTTQTVNWRLQPEPCAEAYKIAPFAVATSAGPFVAGPVVFEPPPVRAHVDGPIEVDPSRDLPPLSWRLVGVCAAALAAVIALVAAAVALVRLAARRVRERLMSPIERAWAELGRLMKKALPERGRYKDFYVELTMVVRRYVQRRYGVRAPHLTTEEFFAELASSGKATPSSLALREFLEAADLVKFAGVEATPAMAEGAVDSARTYLKNEEPKMKAEGAA